MKDKKIILSTLVILVVILTIASSVLVLAQKEGKDKKEKNKSEKTEKIGQDKKKNATDIEGGDRGNSGREPEDKVKNTSSSNEVKKNREDNQGQDKNQGVGNQQGNISEKTTNESVQKKQEKTNKKVTKEDVEKRGKNIVSNLKKVSQRENTRAAQTIEGVVVQKEKSNKTISESVEKINKQGGFKKFLFGSDYKNLGQLRKEIVHNRNQIRRLNEAMLLTESEESKQIILAQIQELEQEREELTNFIKENEEGFSVLGWAFQMLYGYEKVSDEETSNQSEEENDNDDEEEDEEEAGETVEEEEE